MYPSSPDFPQAVLDCLFDILFFQRCLSFHHCLSRLTTSPSLVCHLTYLWLPYFFPCTYKLYPKLAIVLLLVKLFCIIFLWSLSFFLLPFLTHPVKAPCPFWAQLLGYILFSLVSWEALHCYQSFSNVSLPCHYWSAHSLKVSSYLLPFFGQSIDIEWKYYCKKYWATSSELAVTYSWMYYSCLHSWVTHVLISILGTHYQWLLIVADTHISLSYL